MPRALAGRRVAVTGATGFVGGAVVAALRAAGAEVRALLRSRHGAAALQAVGVTPLRAPLRPGPGLAEALAGCDAVVHLAYDVRAAGAVNLAAFDALCLAAQQAGVGRIVHMSSVVVYDDWPGGAGPLGEDSSIGRRPAQGYRAAKIAMEQRLLAGMWPAVILQPTLVWGPGSSLWTDRFVAALRGPGLVLPEPCGTAPLLHVQDLARAVVAGVALPDPGQERFLISGPDTPTWEAVMAAYRRLPGAAAGPLRREPAAAMLAAIGRPGQGREQPGSAARISAAVRRVLGHRVFGALTGVAAGLRPVKAPLQPDSSLLALYLAQPRLDLTHAASRLRFAPEIDLDRGIDAVARTIEHPGRY